MLGEDMERTEMVGSVATSSSNDNSNAEQPQPQGTGGEEGGGADEAAPPLVTPNADGNQNGNNQNKQAVANGVSSHSATTTINGSANSISRPNGVANGSEGSGMKKLLHDPGISLDWTVEEQAILEEGLVRFAGEKTNLNKYIKVANLLDNKNIRDVAFRTNWTMQKKEIGKRRKGEDQNTSKKNKDRKDKPDSVSNKGTQNHVRTGPVPTYIPPPPPIDNDDGISNDAIGGTTGQLLEQNSQIIAQIRVNLAACKLTENTDHLVRFRDNIFAILNGMTNMPGIMSQMPPLPVKLNIELADTILPKSLQAPPPS